jgi:hypothetical protein
MQSNMLYSWTPTLPRAHSETVHLLPLLQVLGLPTPAQLPIIIGKKPDAMQKRSSVT